MKRAFALNGEKINAPYHYTQCGLDDVYLVNGYKVHDTPYGAGVAVEHAEKLHHAIAEGLARDKALLSGKEIRFMRKLMELTQAELALWFGTSAQTVARWEKGTTALNGTADKMIRVLYLASRNSELDVVGVLKDLAEMDSKNNERLVFEETQDGWQRKSA